MKSTFYRFGTKMKVTVWPQKMKLTVYNLESATGQTKTKLAVHRF